MKVVCLSINSYFLFACITCICFRLETTQLLLEYNADYNAKSKYGDDALQTACLKGAVLIFEYLIRTINYSSERLANAHELLGSTFLDEHNDLYTALKHWKIAQTIRETPKGKVLLCSDILFKKLLSGKQLTLVRLGGLKGSYLADRQI